MAEKHTTTANVQLDDSKIEYIRKNFSNPFRFRLVLFSQLPMGFKTGMKIIELTREKCRVTVPYKRINKNPFKSTFWAVLGMAAEMASGAMATMYTYGQKPSIAMLVTGTEAKYYKKAVGITTFECTQGKEIEAAVLKTLATGEPVEVRCHSVGTSEQGETVAEFWFTWSMKARSK